MSQMINMSVEWNDLLLFLQVVERKGFTSAGEALGIPKSRLSRRVTLLEARLGTRLLQRSSRRLSLTDAGQALYAHCQVMLREAEAGIAAVRPGNKIGPKAKQAKQMARRLHKTRALTKMQTSKLHRAQETKKSPKRNQTLRRALPIRLISSA